RGILLTMPPGEQTGLGFDVDLRHIFGRYIVPQTIPYDEEVGKALLMGKAVVAANPRSAAAVQYYTLAQWLGLAKVSENETVDIFGEIAESEAATKTLRVDHDESVDLLGRDENTDPRFKPVLPDGLDLSPTSLSPPVEQSSTAQALFAATTSESATLLESAAAPARSDSPSIHSPP